MNRDELKGKQTPGEAVAKSHGGYTGYAYVPLSMGEECSLIEEADAALYAEAHNVANSTGMWPQDLVDRVKELEASLEKCKGWAWRCSDIDVSGSMQLAAKMHAEEAEAVLNKHNP